MLQQILHFILDHYLLLLQITLQLQLLQPFPQLLIRLLLLLLHTFLSQTFKAVLLLGGLVFLAVVVRCKTLLKGLAFVLGLSWRVVF